MHSSKKRPRTLNSIDFSVALGHRFCLRAIHAIDNFKCNRKRRSDNAADVSHFLLCHTNFCKYLVSSLRNTGHGIGKRTVKVKDNEFSVRNVIKTSLIIHAV